MKKAVELLRKEINRLRAQVEDHKRSMERHGASVVSVQQKMIQDQKELDEFQQAIRALVRIDESHPLMTSEMLEEAIRNKTKTPGAAFKAEAENTAAASVKMPPPGHPLPLGPLAESAGAHASEMPAMPFRVRHTGDALAILRENFADAQKRFENAMDNARAHHANAEADLKLEKACELLASRERENMGRYRAAIDALGTPDGASRLPSREILQRIAENTNSIMLDELLKSIENLRIEGKKIILNTAGRGDFFRRQIEDNKSRIKAAAEDVLGIGPVEIVIE